ncbi:MAG: N(4)-(beta-N-acetylglucosaminyl)-L-asparaginase [Chitinophagaceae bacterium]
MIRRRFLHQLSGLATLPLLSHLTVNAQKKSSFPLVVSTWDAGLAANQAALQLLQQGRKAIDAVEAGVMVTEASLNCCVGLGANPDRDGKVTLDASIMDHQGNCGSVAFLERIAHPIAVARRVMEKTPHVFLVGEGAQQFAVAEGFPLAPATLSSDAAKAYAAWLKTSEYKPQANRENQGHGPAAPPILPSGELNHDTIGMIAIDQMGNLSGSCTTSGMGFKMRGRVGDSPIIGAGLYVDNEVGACVATGQGEEIIKVCGSFLVVELMRNGLSPTKACKEAVRRIAKRHPNRPDYLQACFIAINKHAQIGAFALRKGFSYAVGTSNSNELKNAAYLW